MTNQFGRSRPVPGSTAPAWWSLHRLMTSAAWTWLPRSWAAEWLVLLGLILAEGLSGGLPAFAVASRHG
jgi:hypothetical protein